MCPLKIKKTKKKKRKFSFMTFIENSLKTSK